MKNDAVPSLRAGRGVQLTRLKRVVRRWLKKDVGGGDGKERRGQNQACSVVRAWSACPFSLPFPLPLLPPRSPFSVPHIPPPLHPVPAGPGGFHPLRGEGEAITLTLGCGGVERSCGATRHESFEVPRSRANG